MFTATRCRGWCKRSNTVLVGQLALWMAQDMARAGGRFASPSQTLVVPAPMHPRRGSASAATIRRNCWRGKPRACSAGRMRRRCQNCATPANRRGSTTPSAPAICKVPSAYVRMCADAPFCWWTTFTPPARPCASARRRFYGRRRENGLWPYLCRGAASIWGALPSPQRRSDRKWLRSAVYCS